MTHDQFWKIIADSCRSDPHSADEWDDLLTDALAALPAQDIIEWNDIFDELAQQAYRTDLWAAAYIINGGASDDGFYYFRCWLIGMGQTIYNNAIADPDSLADVASPAWLAEGIDAEAEIYAAAHHWWSTDMWNWWTAWEGRPTVGLARIGLLKGWHFPRVKE